MREVRKFGMADLYAKFLPDRQFSGMYSNPNSPLQSFPKCSYDNVAHRALPDVEAMENLFTLTPLHSLLPSLSLRTPQQQLHQWTVQKKKRSEIQKLVSFFGSKITKAHAGQLLERGITPHDLEQLKLQAETSEVFADMLKSNLGIRSKVLRQRLCNFFL
jgi:hypothetical protein